MSAFGGKADIARSGSAMTITIPNELLTVLIGFALVAGAALVVIFLLR
jgi:hypothetical protein